MPKGKRRRIKGYKSFKQLYTMLEISPDTLARRLVPLRPFLNVPDSGRKYLYTPDEVRLVLSNLR